MPINNSDITLICQFCSKQFIVKKKYNTYAINTKQTSKQKNRLSYCSKICHHSAMKTKIDSVCGQCNKPIKIYLQAKNKSKSGNVFCSRSCSTKYNNTHKTKGTRRSKLEQWLETRLLNLYPQLEIQFNCKDIINSELDIYVPRLKLAFELNGIFHYEPIYGPDKLISIQNNDNRKFQACLEHQIELVIIDTSSQEYFKEKTSIKFLNIIISIIDSKINNI